MSNGGLAKTPLSSEKLANTLVGGPDTTNNFLGFFGEIWGIFSKFRGFSGSIMIKKWIQLKVTKLKLNSVNLTLT